MPVAVQRLAVVSPGKEDERGEEEREGRAVERRQQPSPGEERLQQPSPGEERRQQPSPGEERRFLESGEKRESS